MITPRRPASMSGFTLMEMIVVVGVFGLILTLVGLEFVSVVSHTLHTRANTDAEAQARVIMAKVDTHLRAAYFDVTDFPTASPEPVVAPLPSPSATPADFITFYRVQKGELAGTVRTNRLGVPSPSFELVTIARNPSIPGELDETVTPEPAGTPEPPIVLGTNVSSFLVTPLGGNPTSGSAAYGIQVTVTEPSAHCVSDACTFTLDGLIYVGGQE